jgi:hypothetical protein
MGNLHLVDMEPGSKYRVLKRFKDYHDNGFEPDTILTFVDRDYFAHDGGHTVKFEETTMYLEDGENFDILRDFHLYFEKVGLAEKKTTYKVFVDDNYNSMDESERYLFGEYQSLEDAIQASKNIIDKFLHSSFHEGMSTEELLTGYKAYGEDPFIVSSDTTESKMLFSAWEYAEQKCKAMCEAGDKMEVILYQEAFFYFLKKGNDYYLDVNCVYSSQWDFSLFLKLNEVEYARYRECGQSMVKGLAGLISDNAEEYLDREIKGPLADESSKAISEWQTAQAFLKWKSLNPDVQN